MFIFLRKNWGLDDEPRASVLLDDLLSERSPKRLPWRGAASRVAAPGLSAETTSPGVGDLQADGAVGTTAGIRTAWDDRLCHRQRLRRRRAAPGHPGQPPPAHGDFFYEDAWFIRVQNVTLGYTLSPRTLAKIKCISNLRIHTDINNLCVFTPYSGLDPETDSFPAAYPNARTFSVGIDVQF